MQCGNSSPDDRVGHESGGILGDWAYVAIIGILAVAFVIYYGFVFGRIVIIKFKLSDTEKQIEVEAGKRA